MAAVTHSPSKFKLTRLGRKLQVSDEQRTIAALPKDIPERTWAEILQKEDVDLCLFEIREQILEDALEIVHEKYMARQNAIFTAHCAAKAWLKLIDWHFYRHDPGEEPTAYPPCYIPKRLESWTPDEIPEPSPKDTWGLQDLPVSDLTTDEKMPEIPSTTSLDYPVVEEIPLENRFPGRVEHIPETDVKDVIRLARPKRPLVVPTGKSGVWAFTGEGSDSTETQSEEIGIGSEVLQKVTDYVTEEVSKRSSLIAVKTSPINGSSQGGGDSQIPRIILSRPKIKKNALEKRKSSFSSARLKHLPPLDLGDSRSRLSIISDCRLRNLRLDTQFEISSEKMETPPGETVKRK